MVERMTVRQKFWSGYLPYTGAVWLLLCVLIVLVSGPAAIAAFLALLVIGAGFGLCQLVILALPARHDDRARFHTDCLIITFASLFVVPALMGAFAKLVATP